jgi:hypothetical protein
MQPGASQRIDNIDWQLGPGKFAVVAGAALTTLCCTARLVHVLRGEDVTN